MNKETLEEFAERFVSSTRLKNPKSFIIEGAKWQQENSYSEAMELQKARAIMFLHWFTDREGMTVDSKRITQQWCEELFEMYGQTLCTSIKK